MTTPFDEVMKRQRLLILLSIGAALATIGLVLSAFGVVQSPL